MAQHSELKGSKQKPVKAKPENELAERDLDQISGGTIPQTTTTPPSGPIPIPYPNRT